MALVLRSQLVREPIPDAREGMQIRWGERAGVRLHQRGLCVSPGLPLLTPDPYAECWTSAGTPRPVRQGRMHLLEHRDVLFVTWHGPDDNLRKQTEQAYREVLSACQTRGFEHPARIWNFFGDIHAEEAGRDRYQAFCMGRAAALESLRIPLGSMPAATAIGSDERNLVIYLIATRHPAQPIENPRQVSAYHYPERYSPKSPSFARATRLETADGPLILLSGTASIVGHESRHAGDVIAQTHEILTNLQALHDTAGRDLSPPAWLRIYLRHPEDRPKVADAISQYYAATRPGPALQWVRGDICRRELLLEIEGIHA